MIPSKRLCAITSEFHTVKNPENHQGSIKASACLPASLLDPSKLALGILLVYTEYKMLLSYHSQIFLMAYSAMDMCLTLTWDSVPILAPTDFVYNETAAIRGESSQRSLKSVLPLYTWEL